MEDYVSLNVHLNKKADRIIRIFKEMNDLPNKSEAVNAYILRFQGEAAEPELREEVVKELQKDAADYERRFKGKRKMTLAELEKI